MKITVKVKPGARREGVRETGAGSYRVEVTAPPEGGKANDAVIKALAKYLGKSKSRIFLVAGEKSRTKIFEVY